MIQTLYITYVPEAKEQLRGSRETARSQDKARRNGLLIQEENPLGRSRGTFPSIQQAHDELYKFISESKDKLGGDDSVFLLPGLFTLAEVHIIEGNLKKAEEYLNAAHWSFLKSNDKFGSDKRKEKGIVLTPEEELTTKVSLHRTFAKLYEVKGDFKDAINELKQSVSLSDNPDLPGKHEVGPRTPLRGSELLPAGEDIRGLRQPIGGRSILLEGGINMVPIPEKLLREVTPRTGRVPHRAAQPVVGHKLSHFHREYISYNFRIF